MNQERDLDRLIGTLLEEGAVELPERTYERVRTSIERTHQRATFGPWRFPRMSMIISSLGGAAAAVVVLAVVLTQQPGANVSPGAASEAASHPAASPLVAPSASPSSGPSGYRWPGALPAGTYTTDFAFDHPVAMTFTVPEGWESRDIGIVKGDRLALMFMIVDNVYTEPCSGVLRDPATGPTVDELVEALADMPGLSVTEPSTTTLGGRGARYLEYELLPEAACAPFERRILHLAELHCDTGCSAVGEREVGVELPGESVRNRAWIVDGEGRFGRIVVQAVSSADATQADGVELDAVVDSIGFERTGPEGSPTPRPEPAASEGTASL